MCFRLRNLEKLLSFESSTLEFVKNEFLAKTVNFGIESAFSKGQGSVFSKDPGPGPGPFYKVCWYRRTNFHVD